MAKKDLDTVVYTILRDLCSKATRMGCEQVSWQEGTGDQSFYNEAKKDYLVVLDQTKEQLLQMIQDGPKQ